MKQEIHTIPVAEAFTSGDECPFCHLERQTEQRAIRYFAGPGASYMEPTVRGITNQYGFCSQHMKRLFDYGNALGTALMLQTYCARMLEQLQTQQLPEKKGLFRRKKSDTQPYWQTLEQEVKSCAVCNQVEQNMQRQYQVFFDLLKEEEFRGMVEHSKGFCLRHFARLLQEGEKHLPQSQATWFYATAYRLMQENLFRVKGDLDWLIEKYDYRNADADWGNSRDALQRMIQKLSGIYPSDPLYRQE